jgi:N-acetylglucosamine kinase-like BadF-type ATPase
MGVIGVDGGNSKTELLVATLEGEPVSYVRGPGSNTHDIGTDGCIEVLRGLLERAGVNGTTDVGGFFLCGADLPSDIAELTQAVDAEGWVREAIVDNDTFALLRAGAAPDVDAVAVICGSGINCVGRTADGRIARYPSLGWETGDWGGSVMIGREALFHAARAEDGRGEPTALVDVVCRHFGTDTVAAAGAAVHYRGVGVGDLAPDVLRAAETGDAVARSLVERLAEEITLMATRALADLELTDRGADVVLGGGMIRRAEGLLFDEVAARLTRVVVVPEPPVLGAALAALDAAGAPANAERRLRAAFRAGLRAG